MGRLALILAAAMVTGGMQGQVANPASAASARDARIAEVVTVTTLPAKDGRAAWMQTMDYYKPAGTGPHPAVVIVHGGGFTGGTSRNGSEAYCADFLAPAGYAVFSTNYRLAPGATFDDMVEDVQRAIRYVRGNAEKYGVDAGKIAVLGGSAGGYLSNRVGVEEPAAGTGTEAWEKSSDGVQAVVTLYGISDWAGMPHVSKVMELGVLGKGTPSGEDMSQASPIEHVREGLPPFLLIHGDKDEAVPLDQSTAFADALKEKGDKAEVIVIPGGPHATVSWHTLPGVPEWEKEMTVWLNGVLGHTGAVGEGIEKRTAGVGGAER